MSDINEALYQIKQRIKMHEIDGTTSNENEREKALLDYINKLQERVDYLIDRNDEKEDRINKAIEYIENYKDIKAKYVYVDFDLEDLDKLLNILKCKE